MWASKRLMVAVELFFYMLIQSEALCTCRRCIGCTVCSPIACSRNGRFLSLLEYIETYGREMERQLQVTSPVISCTVPDTLCDYPHNKYCCALQPDGTKTCGLGEGWSTCVSGSTLINNVITPMYTKSLCDFDFSCTGNFGNDCCGGLDLYEGEGPGTCSTSYCTSLADQIVAGNYIGSATTQYKTPAFDASLTLNGIDMPTQVNTMYCAENNDHNRNNGRCRASNLCCSRFGLCDVDPDSCATKSVSWVWMAGSINDWVQTGGPADSFIPCGNGTIGNGRCETDSSTYGVTCCSDTGHCSSSNCNGAGGNLYQCRCAHGIPGSGTKGCNICASCSEGYYMSSSKPNTCTPIKLGNFNCNAGAFVTSIDFWYDSTSKFITGIDFFKCSDGSQVNVYKGQSTGSHRSSPDVGGYCGGCVSWVYKPFGTTNQLTTELTVWSCNDVKYRYGAEMSGDGTHNYQVGGDLLTGMQAATCAYGSLTNLCFLAFTFTTVQTPNPTSFTVAPTGVPTTSKPTFVPSTTSPTKTSKPSTVSPTTPMPSIVKPSTVPPAAPVPSTLQPNTLAPTSKPGAVNYQCSTGFVIDTITLRSGTCINAISSYNCKDANGNFKTKTVGVGDSTMGTSVTITGPFTSFSSGYAVSPDPADVASGLSFVRTDGSKVPKSSLPRYGTAYTGVTTHSCPSGQVLYGFSLVKDSSGTMVGASMTPRCRNALTAAPSPAPT